MISGKGMRVYVLTCCCFEVNKENTVFRQLTNDVTHKHPHLLFDTGDFVSIFELIVPNVRQSIHSDSIVALGLDR
jgi:hypothetical protein